MDNIRKSAKSTSVAPCPPPPPPTKKKTNNKKQEVNIIRTGRAGEENILFEAPQKLCLSGGPWNSKGEKGKKKDEKRGKRKEGRKKKRKLWCVRVRKGESIEERNNCRDFGKELLGKHRSSNVSVSTIAFFFYSGAPWVSKSTHPRKFGNHVTVHRPLPARPSAPQAKQMLNLTLSS